MARVSETTKNEYRRRLLDAAATEFANKGLEGARVDDISLAAGLAKGTIYNYFDSKIEVFLAVVGEWIRRSAEARVPVSVDAPIREQLRAVIAGDMQAVAQMEDFARVTFREVLAAPPEIVAQLLPAWDPVDQEIQRLIGNAQAAGQLRSDRSAQEMARIFVTLVNGLVIEQWMPDSTVALGDIADLAVDYFIEGARV